MCLITDNPKPRVADHPIFCWKILFRINARKFRSPYMCAHYEIGKTYEETGKTKVRQSVLNSLPDLPGYMVGDCVWEVGGGFIHAYKRLSAALLELNDAPTSTSVLIRCVVPEGTPHYISTDGNEICARGMTLIGIYDPYDHERIGFRLKARLRQKRLRLKRKLLDC